MGDNQVMDVVAKRLYLLRKRRDLTLGQVETYTGVPKSSLSALEHNQSSLKTIQYLAGMASFYGVTLDYLFGFTNDPNAKIMESFQFEQEPGPATPNEQPPAHGSLLTAEERWLALFRQLPAAEQLALLQTMEQYLGMDDDQRAVVDRMLVQFKRLSTPRIIGGEE